MFLKTTDEHEILNILKSMKNKTSSGIDRISPKLLKNCAEYVVDLLTILINRSMAAGLFPDSLKLAKVIPIYKDGDREDFSNYRPVSLLPVLGKVYERVIYAGFLTYIDKFSLLDENQFGFRKKHKTVDALACVIQQIRQAMDQKQSSCCIFLDLTKAFETLDHDILLSKLESFGFRGRVLTLLKSYLNNRKQVLQLDSYRSSCQSVKCGVSQGSVLGPLLFLLYINDLPRHVKACTTFFADDTNIFYNENTSLQSLADIHDKVDDWMRSNKLKCNLDKSTAVCFGKNTVNHQMEGFELIIRQKLKYLGVIIDEKLSFKDTSKVESKLLFCNTEAKPCFANTCEVLKTK